MGAVAQPAETLSPEELIRRHTTDIDLLLKYGLTEHALQSADKGLAIDPNNEAILIKRKDAAAALGRRDDVVNTLLRLATVIENRGAGEQAMKVLADLLQLQPNHAEATQRLRTPMRRLACSRRHCLIDSALPASPMPILQRSTSSNVA